MNRKSKASARCKRSKRPLSLEILRERSLMAADASLFQQPIATSPAEQMMIEQINRARTNPSAEAERLGIGLNDGLPANSINPLLRPPLAPNASLLDASRSHSDDMLGRGFFAHTSPDGKTPNDRAVEAGYTLGAGENIANHYASEVNQSSVQQAHDLLFRSAGHRQNLLNERYDDIGIGFSLSPAVNAFGGPMYTTEMFGLGDSSSALTGVVYDDGIIDDDFYSIGEGWSEVAIEATDAMGRTYSTVTNEAGGFTLHLPQGQYEVIARHPEGLVTQARSIEIGGENVKLDFTSNEFAVPRNTTGNKKDINGDGIVSHMDALQIINRVDRGRPFDAKYDVNGDGYVSPIDVLIIVNELNRSNVPSASSPLVNPIPSEDSLVSGEMPALTSDPTATSQAIGDSANEKLTTEFVAELAEEIEQARTTVGSWLKVPAELIQVESARFVTFENDELGTQDRFSGQSLTEGYQIILRYRTAMYDFRGAIGSAPVFNQYASINQHIGEDEAYCCPWETLGQHCLDAIDAAIEDFTSGIVQ